MAYCKFYQNNKSIVVAFNIEYIALIGSLIYDYVKLYNEPTAVDNYTATGYFQKCENNVIILDSCIVVYMGNTNFYDSYRIPKKQLDSTTLLQMSKSHTKMTISFRGFRNHQVARL